MKGIEWIKLKTSMCEDETMRLLDSMERYRDPAHYVWIRLLLQAGKTNDNGLIYLKKDVPYTKEMISILFNRPIDIIEKVLEILESFKLIEIYENNIIKIRNWEKHQNIEGMKRVRESNRERVKKCRERKKIDNKPLINETANKNEGSANAVDNSISTNNTTKNKNCNANVTLQKEKREEDKKKEKKNIDKRESRVKNNTSCTKESKIDSSGKVNLEFKEVSLSHEDANEKALKIIKAIEDAKVKIKGLTIKFVKEILEIHQEKYLIMAMDKAIEKNKLDINYINGILNNWLREGYPKTYEEMEFNNCGTNNLPAFKEKPSLRFINFEPRQYDYDDLERKLLGWTEDS